MSVRNLSFTNIEIEIPRLKTSRDSYFRHKNFENLFQVKLSFSYIGEFLVKFLLDIVQFGLRTRNENNVEAATRQFECIRLADAVRCSRHNSK